MKKEELENKLMRAFSQEYKEINEAKIGTITNIISATVYIKYQHPDTKETNWTREVQVDINPDVNLIKIGKYWFSKDNLLQFYEVCKNNIEVAIPEIIKGYRNAEEKIKNQQLQFFDDNEEIRQFSYILPLEVDDGIIKYIQLNIHIDKEKYCLQFGENILIKDDFLVLSNNFEKIISNVYVPAYIEKMKPIKVMSFSIEEEETKEEQQKKVELSAVKNNNIAKSVTITPETAQKIKNSLDKMKDKKEPSKPISFKIKKIS